MDHNKPPPHAKVPPTAVRIRNLRKALQLSQDALAVLGGFPRTYMVRFENGENKASSHLARQQLAQAFGLLYDDFVSYLEGRTSLTDTVAARNKQTRAEALLDPPNLADLLREGQTAYSVAAVDAARGFWRSERRDLSPDRWREFMRGVMVEERRALQASALDDDDPPASEPTPRPVRAVRDPSVDPAALLTRVRRRS